MTERATIENILSQYLFGQLSKPGDVSAKLRDGLKLHHLSWIKRGRLLSWADAVDEAC